MQEGRGGRRARGGAGGRRMRGWVGGRGRGVVGERDGGSLGYERDLFCGDGTHTDTVNTRHQAQKNSARAILLFFVLLSNLIH